MDFLEYTKYIQFTCDEELERLGEFLWCVTNKVDQTGDKSYLTNPPSIPDLETVEEFVLNTRDMKKDFEIIDSDDDDKKDDLYQELRELLSI